MNLEQLPRELLGEQLRHLHFRDINKLCKTSRSLSQRCRQQPLQKIIQQKREEYEEQVQAEIINQLERALEANSILQLQAGDLFKSQIPGYTNYVIKKQNQPVQDIDHREALEYIEDAIDEGETIIVRIPVYLDKQRARRIERELGRLPQAKVNLKDKDWHFVKLDLGTIFDTWYEEGLK